MYLGLLLHGHCHHQLLTPALDSCLHFKANFGAAKRVEQSKIGRRFGRATGLLSLRWKTRRPKSVGVQPISASLQPLDLTEDNVKQVLDDARAELGQIFDDSVGITGVVELAELDGPFVKISLKGRFWHKRSTVLERLANYLKQRIPEILEVDVEDEKQLDDSPANF